MRIQKATLPTDAGIVDEDVELAKLFRDEASYSLPISIRRDVQRYGIGLKPFGYELVAACVASCCVLPPTTTAIPF